MKDPAIGEILVQQDDLAHRVRAIGEEISDAYRGRSLLLIGVLKGAMFFLSDLMRELIALDEHLSDGGILHEARV